MGLANLYLSVGKLPRAQQLVGSALELNNSDPGIWETYGKCLQVEGRFEEAEEKLNHALKLDPHRVGAHRALAKMKRPAEVEEESLGLIDGLLGATCRQRSMWRDCTTPQPTFASAATTTMLHSPTIWLRTPFRPR